MAQKPRIFKGWLMVLAGMITLGMSVGLVANAFSVFIVPISGELGFSRSQISFTQTIFAIGMMVVAFFWGQIYKRFRLKRLMLMSAIIMSAAYFCFSIAKSLILFYAISVVVAFSSALIAWMPFTMIISNWFTSRRGFAIGITFMGSGIGGMLFSSLGGALVASVGWRATFMIYSGVLALCVIPTIAFIVKIKPSDVGLEPLGGHAEANGDMAEKTGYTLKEARSTPAFYLLVICVFMLGICMNSLNTTIAPHMQSEGFSNVFSANVVAGYMAALAVGKLCLGWLFDKLGPKKASIVSLSMLAAALFTITKAYVMPAVILMVLFAGCGNSYGSVAYPLIIRQVYGEKEFAAINGIVISVGSLGSAIGPTLSGVVFDKAGSYNPAYYAMCAMVIVFGAGIVAILINKGRDIKA